MASDNKTSFGIFSKDIENNVIDIKISRKIPDGVYIWVEILGFGHAFLSVHKNGSNIVYTYGRYDDVDSIKITGEGVFIKYTGNLAIAYMKNRLYKSNASCNVYKISDANVEQAIAVSDALWNSSSEQPDNEKTAREIKTHGRIIDDYNLFFRNCVTTTIKLIEESGSNVFNDWELDPISPHSLFIQLDMKSQVKKQVIKYTEIYKLNIKRE